MAELRPEVEVVVDNPVGCSTDLQAVTSWTLSIEDISDGRPEFAYSLADAGTARSNIAQVAAGTHNSC